MVFKIGITCTPLVRWRAYDREGYQQMHLLHVTEEPGLVQMLEAVSWTSVWLFKGSIKPRNGNRRGLHAVMPPLKALISEFQGRPGCRNVARGGEGLWPPCRLGPCQVRWAVRPTSLISWWSAAATGWGSCAGGLVGSCP